MLDPECRARSAIRYTRASGAYRSRLSVTVLGGGSPGCCRRAGELAETRALAKLALGAYVADRRELSTAWHTGDAVRSLDTPLLISPLSPSLLE
jgi:hypothetical protein